MGFIQAAHQYYAIYRELCPPPVPPPPRPSSRGVRLRPSLILSVKVLSFQSRIEGLNLTYMLLIGFQNSATVTYLRKTSVTDIIKNVC